MSLISQIVLCMLAGFFIWRSVQFFKANPDTLSKDKIQKTLGLLGVLALILIAFVTFLVTMLRMG